VNRHADVTTLISRYHARERRQMDERTRRIEFRSRLSSGRIFAHSIASCWHSRAGISDSCLSSFESAIVSTPINVICLIAVKARVSYGARGIVENQPSIRGGTATGRREGEGKGGCDRRGRGVMTVMNKRMHVSNANSAPQLQECIIRR